MKPPDPSLRPSPAETSLLKTLSVAGLLKEIRQAFREGDKEKLQAAAARGERYFPGRADWGGVGRLERGKGPAFLEAIPDHAVLAGRTRSWHLSRIPKKAHFYWGNDRISFLRFLSVYSFRKLNPDWEINLYLPKETYRGGASWSTGESYEGEGFEGKDYSDELFSLPGLRIREVDFSALPALQGVPETFRSDFCRWHVLGHEGGVYCDIDILFFRPMDELYVNHEGNKELETAYCLQEYGHIIGFFLASQANPMFRFLAESSLARLDTSDYQAIGSKLMNALLPSESAIQARFPGMLCANLPMGVMYALDHTEIDRIFEGTDFSGVAQETLGIHWYGGSALAQKYNKLLQEDNYPDHDCVLTRLIGHVLKGAPAPAAAPWLLKSDPAAPRFTIMVPSYNQADYLKEALDSLLAQTLEDWEAVVVDDGSTDHTPEVLAGYQARDPRIRAIRQPNGGVASALNAALSNARGEWICWLSSDDLFEPEALEHFSRGIEENPQTQFFYSNFSQLFHESGQLSPIAAGRGAILPSRNFQTLAFFSANYVNGITICIRKALFDRVGKFNPALRYAQDFDMWLRMSSATELRFLDERTAITRVHALQGTTGFPEAGDFDSARACLMFLNRHPFNALFPFLDLQDLESARAAVRVTLEVALNPGSWIYKGVGFVPSLLERFGEWLDWECPIALQADLRLALEQLHGTMTTLPGTLRRTLKDLAEGRPTPFVLRDPVGAAIEHHRSAKDRGDQAQEALLRRYLVQVIGLPAQEPFAVPAAPTCTARAPHGDPPTFTILLPCFNEEPLLEGSLASLQAQSRQDWEALVVDDGSLDGTARLTAESASRDPRIRLLRTPRLGLPVSVNEGLRSARGTWVHWMTPGDALLPETLGHWASASVAFPEAGGFHGDFQELDHFSGRRRRGQRSRGQGMPERRFQVLELADWNFVKRATACIRKSLLDQIGGFDPAYRHAPELDLWLRIAQVAPLECLPEVLATSRTRIPGRTHEYKPPMVFDLTAACISFFNRHGFRACFPFVDLGKPQECLEAMRRTLVVVTNPQAQMYAGTLWTPALAERLGEWLQAEGSRELRDAMSKVLRDLAGIRKTLPAQVEQVLARIEAQRGGTYQPYDPREEMRKALDLTVRLGKQTIDSRGLARYLELPEASAWAAEPDPVPTPIPLPPSEPQPETPRGRKEGFLFEPDWAASDWVEVLLSFLGAFEPEEGVGLILNYDAAAAGAPPLEEAEASVIQIVQATGRERFPDVLIVDRPEELLPALKAFHAIQRIRPRGAPGSELTGPFGIRFARVREQLRAPRSGLNTE